MTVVPSHEVAICSVFKRVTGGKPVGAAQPPPDGVRTTAFLLVVFAWWLAGGHPNISIKPGALITMALPAPHNTLYLVIHIPTTAGQNITKFHIFPNT